MKTKLIPLAALTLFAAACTDSVAPITPSHRLSLGLSQTTTSTLLVDTGPGSTAFIGSSSLFSSGSTTCSPQPSCAASYQFLAGQFTLSDGATLESVEGWMWNNAGTIDVRIRTDNAGLPGSSVYSRNYTVGNQSSLGWRIFAGYTATLTAGTYWLSFEPTANGGFSGGMSPGAPSPLSKYAFLSFGNPGWAQLAGVRSSLGFRLIGVVTQTPEEMISDLRTTIADIGLPKGTANSLDAKLRAALSALGVGDSAVACSALQDLINALNAQSGKKISAPDASALILSVDEIRLAIGC